MELTPVELLNGVFSIIFVIISVAIGLRIILRYVKFKQKVLLLVGLTWLGLVSIWYASSISVLSILLFNQRIPDELFMFIGNGFLPLTSCIWIYAFTELLYHKRQKQLLLIFVAIGLVFEIYFLYYLFTDISVLGEIVSPVDASYNLPMTLYQVSLLVMIIVTGELLARESLRSDKPEIRLKGKFLAIAFPAFVLGAVFEILSDISIVILIVGRLILIISALSFYFGFILPQKIKDLLLK
ncbi:MAG: hypothetical protein EU521_00965 [Promethearchaeota archaeon]|nr:MAG: hypothetical protein EU521_00965 [Candidatus Lokiarchaeota archaeon]